jgi:hypothetical protein
MKAVHKCTAQCLTAILGGWLQLFNISSTWGPYCVRMICFRRVCFESSTLTDCVLVISWKSHDQEHMCSFELVPPHSHISAALAGLGDGLVCSAYINCGPCLHHCVVEVCLFSRDE